MLETKFTFLRGFSEFYIFQTYSLIKEKIFGKERKKKKAVQAKRKIRQFKNASIH